MGNITISVQTIGMVVLLFCGIIVFKKRKETSDNSRTYLGLFQLVSAGMLATSLILSFFGKTIFNTKQLLTPSIITGGTWSISLFMLYPIMVMRAGRLKATSIITLFVPAILMTLPHLFGMEFIELYSWADFTRNLTQPDVIIRLLGILIAIVISTLLIILPYNWRHSSADFKWIIRVTLMSQGITVLYILALFTTRDIYINLHMLWASFTTIYFARYELVERILPSASSETTENAQAPIADIINRSHDLWTNIDYIMDHNQIWRNPDTTVETLSKDMGTNRIYVADSIREHTGLTFNDYMNRKRAMFMADQLRLNPKQDQKSLFYEAGFRSRQTAYRNFVKFIGCSHTDFISAL